MIDFACLAALRGIVRTPCGRNSTHWVAIPE